MLLTPAERLIVAADFKPTDLAEKDWVKAQVLGLAYSLRGTGVYLKVNSALRVCGYDLIGEIQSRGLRVFADLKLFDIGETLATDGALLRRAKPDILTVACVADVAAMRALKAELTDTEVLGITILTSQTEEGVRHLYDSSIEAAVMKLALLGETAGVDGFISSAMEAGCIRDVITRPMTINTPGIRPKWAIIAGDDQNPNRIMTPAKAIQAGADRIVVGRPITRAVNPYDAVMWTLDEIASATA